MKRLVALFIISIVLFSSTFAFAFDPVNDIYNDANLMNGVKALLQEVGFDPVESANSIIDSVVVREIINESLKSSFDATAVGSSGALSFVLPAVGVAGMTTFLVNDVVNRINDYESLTLPSYTGSFNSSDFSLTMYYDWDGDGSYTDPVGYSYVTSDGSIVYIPDINVNDFQTLNIVDGFGNVIMSFVNYQNSIYQSKMVDDTNSTFNLPDYPNYDGSSYYKVNKFIDAVVDGTYYMDAVEFFKKYYNIDLSTESYGSSQYIDGHTYYKLGNNVSNISISVRVKTISGKDSYDNNINEKYLILDLSYYDNGHYVSKEFVRTAPYIPDGMFNIKDEIVLPHPSSQIQLKPVDTTKDLTVTYTVKDGTISLIDTSTGTDTSTDTSTDTGTNTGTNPFTSPGTNYDNLPDADISQPVPSDENTIPSDKIDFNPLKKSVSLLTEKFPFSLPWDVYRAVKSLYVPGELPTVDFIFYNPITKETMHNEVNLGDAFPAIVTLAPLVRGGFVIIFIMGMIYATQKLFGGVN
jgi:hypothetical protein